MACEWIYMHAHIWNALQTLCVHLGGCYHSTSCLYHSHEMKWCWTYQKLAILFTLHAARGPSFKVVHLVRNPIVMSFVVLFCCFFLFSKNLFTINAFINDKCVYFLFDLTLLFCICMCFGVHTRERQRNTILWRREGKLASDRLYIHLWFSLTSHHLIASFRIHIRQCRDRRPRPNREYTRLHVNIG